MCPVAHKPFAQKVAEVAPIVIGPLIVSVVEDYLEENPPVGGLTIEEIKADSEIADSILHSQTTHLQFEGLLKITSSPTPPSNPSVGDWWCNTSQ